MVVQVGDRVVWRRKYGGVVKFIPGTVTRVGKYITIELDERYPDGRPQHTSVQPKHLAKLEAA